MEMDELDITCSSMHSHNETCQVRMTSARGVAPCVRQELWDIIPGHLVRLTHVFELSVLRVELI